MENYQHSAQKIWKKNECKQLQNEIIKNWSSKAQSLPSMTNTESGTNRFEIDDTQYAATKCTILKRASNKCEKKKNK